MSHDPAPQLDNFPLNRACSGNPVRWEQTQLTVDATEADEYLPHPILTRLPAEESWTDSDSGQVQVQLDEAASLKLTVDATKANKHYHTQINQHVALVPQKPPQGHRSAEF